MLSGEPAPRAPSALTALARQVTLAAADNADGHPTRAARRLRPALARLDALGAAPEVGRVRARAVLELAKSDFEVRGDASTHLDRLAGLADDGGQWPGFEPAVAGLRGLLHLRAGRVEASLRELDAAIDLIDQAEVIDACCALLNRGVLYLERGDLNRARRDLTDCGRRAQTAQLPLLVFKASHNLGYLEYLAGRLPLSLERMAEAARSDSGELRAIALLDRARVLVEAGLVGVADETLCEAAGIFAVDKLTHDLAETELARAECALLRADLDAAAGFAVAARRRFTRRGDEAWALRATLLEMQAEAASLAQRDAVEAAPRAARRRSWAALARRCSSLEHACAASGRTQWAYVAAMLRTQAEVAAGTGPSAGALLKELDAVPVGAPIGVRLQAHRLRAEIALRAGERGRAARQIRTGQRELALHRARFGSIDLRTASAVHGAALAELDLRLALEGGRAAAVFDAAERSRAVIRGTRRVNPPADPDRARLLSELRQLLESSRELERRPAADPERQRARRESSRLRQAIQERSWQDGDDAPTDRPGRARDVVRALASRPETTVVNVLEHRGRVVVARMSARGSTLHELGAAGALREQTRRVHADLPVIANPYVPAALRRAAQRSLTGVLELLDDAVRGVVEAPGELVVITGDWLGALPWSMLASRSNLPTVVAPSARHWLAFGPRRRAGALGGAHLSSVAGPGLEHALREAEQVAVRWPGSTLLTGTAATCAEAARLLRSPGVVHLAAHGRHEADNPLFSSVRLVDGPLFAHELDGGGAAPELVLLSSCEVGRTTVRPGGEALGLTSVLLRTGVGCVVAAIAPLADDVALRVMTRTHELIRQGRDVPGALAHASCEAADGAPVPLVCFGAPA